MRAVALMSLFVCLATSAQAEERLCDPQLENCRAPILRLIREETQRIDAAFWYMNDARYAAALMKRHRSGLPIRILMDERSVISKPKSAAILKQLRAAGVPMRTKRGGQILHWKMFLFHGQNVVQFSKANYSPHSFVPSHLDGGQPGGWFDEAVYFTSDLRVVDSFRTQFDAYWTDTKGFDPYSQGGQRPVRAYPVTPIAPYMNFHPGQDFNARVLDRINHESVAIDLIHFRITEARHANALTAAVRRGVRVRLISEPDVYTSPPQVVHRLNIDRLAAAGVEIKHRIHRGLTHEGLVVLHGLGEVVFGSANLSTYLIEHNLFYAPGTSPLLDSGETVFDWFATQFERKWNNEAAFIPFHPK